MQKITMPNRIDETGTEKPVSHNSEASLSEHKNGKAAGCVGGFPYRKLIMVGPYGAGTATRFAGTICGW